MVSESVATFSISGLWHGASFTFIVWGVLHGLLLIMENLTSEIRKKISAVINFGRLNFVKTFVCVGYTFVVTCITWILFRAETFNDAFYIIKRIFSELPKVESIDKMAELFPEIARQNLYVAVFGIALLFVVDLICTKSDFRTVLNKVPMFARIAIYAVFTLLILVFGAYETKSFIYFQF